MLRGGFAWRLAPNNLPPRSTTFGYFRERRDEGRFARTNHTLVMADLERVGREALPTTAVPDGRSVKSTQIGGPRCYEAVTKSRTASTRRW